MPTASESSSGKSRDIGVQKDQKKPKKAKNARSTMDGLQLQLIRQEIGFAPRHMYLHLGIPRRTYQDYESGRRGIPDSVKDAVIAELKWYRAFIAGMPARVDQAAQEEFPYGIPSEI
jgi:DNA-binding transcriptional regulator YiaG